MLETLKLRIPEGQVFAEHTKALNEAIQYLERGSSQGRSIKQEVDDYFTYLRNEGPAHREEPGTMAEFAAVMRCYLPIPPRAAEVHPFRFLVTDLSALYASTFLNVGGVQAQYYLDWRDRRIQDFDSGAFYDALPLFAHGADVLVNEGSLDLKTKALLLELIADLLPDNTFDPTDQLRSIQAAERITPALLLALQIWQRRHADLKDGGPKSEVEVQLGMLFTPVNGSLENTLLYWVADPDGGKSALGELSEYLFVQWGWLKPIAYTAVAAAERNARTLSDRQSDTEHNDPKSLVQRLVEPEGRGFPCVIDPEKGQRYGFTPVPILPVGGSGYGKTSFLCAFTDAIIKSAKGFEDGTHIRSQKLLDILHQQGDEWTTGQPISRTLNSSNLGFEAGRDGMDTNRWVRMEVSDYRGEFATIDQYDKDDKDPDAAYFPKKLRTARGLLFFIDDRLFNPPKGKTPVEYGRKLAAWYQKLLRDFMQANDDCRHVPIALVINKADRIFGPDWFEKFGTTNLIPEGSQRGIERGSSLDGDPETPYQRLCKAIRYNKAISRRLESQERVLQMIEYFQVFFDEILRWTNRYQIFLTTSINIPGQPTPTVRGVTESMHWMIQHLLVIFGHQAGEQLEVDSKSLDELVGSLSGKMDEAGQHRETWLKQTKDLKERKGESQNVFGKAFDRIVGTTTAELTEMSKSNAESLKSALDFVCEAAKVDGFPSDEGPPYVKQYQVAERAIEQLKKQKGSLEGWRRDLDRMLNAATEVGN